MPASSSLVALTSHGLFAATGAETTVSSNAPAASAGTSELNPKRTSTSMGIKSGTVSSDIVARTTTGGLKGFSRSAADRYTAYEGTTATEVATAAGSLSSYPLPIGARPSNAAGAPVAGTFYTGTVELLYVGGPLTASQEAALASAWSTYTTAIASLSRSRMATISRSVVIYGATFPGLVAARKIAAMGFSVAVLEWTGHVGGLTTGGLGKGDVVGGTRWGLVKAFLVADRRQPTLQPDRRDRRSGTSRRARRSGP